MIREAVQMPPVDRDFSCIEGWRAADLVGEAPTRYGPMTFFRNDRGALTQSLQAYGEWAEHEITICGRFVQAGDTVVDVGAYIGTHGLAFAQRVGPAGKVYSFEAQPASFALLAHNLAAAEHGGIVTAVNAAVSHAGTGSSVLLDEIDITAPSSYGSAAIGAAHGGLHRVSVPTVTLDTLKLTTCALVKIDVEGMEDQVLQGAEQLLRSCGPVVYAECNAVDPGSRVAARLRAYGYEVWMHVCNAFNPQNWRAQQRNIFGDSKEVALVGVPPRHRITCQLLRAGVHESFFEIGTLDDLVAGMLLKPQYPREVLRHTTAITASGRSP